MAGGVILGLTGSFTGVDASGKFKQATLRFSGVVGGAASGSSSKPSGGGGKASGGALFGFSVSAQPQKAGARKKVFDDSGAWNGCCYCGAKAKVGGRRAGCSQRLWACSLRTPQASSSTMLPAALHIAVPCCCRSARSRSRGELQYACSCGWLGGARAVPAD